MKKIFTLALVSLFTLAVSAADHKPTVTVNSSKKYEIVIDGKSYQNISSLSIPFLRDGNHSIQVYQLNKGFFFQKRKTMVASSGFQLRNNDIMINVDMFGQIRITESRSRFDQGGRNDKGWDNSQGHDDNKGYDKDHSAGRNDHDRKF